MWAMAPTEKQERDTIMKMKTIMACALAALCLATFAQGERKRRPNGDERPRRHATAGGENAGERQRHAPENGERQRLQIDDETRKLIAAYRSDPSEANKAALKKKVEANYDKMLEQRKAKLKEMKDAGRDQQRISMMEQRLSEMQQNRETRIEKMMSRFMDGKSRNAPDAKSGKDEGSASAEPEAREGRRPRGRRGERSARSKRDRQGEGN